MAEEAATVAIRNGSSQADMGDRTAAYLQEQGLNVTEVSDAAYTASTSITYYAAKPYTLKYLVDLTGISQDYQVVYAYDPAISPQIVVVLGDDFAATNKLP